MAPTPSRDDPRDTTLREYRALGVLALVAALVFLGALVAFTLRPLHLLLRKWTGKSDLSAFLCATLTWAGFTGGIGGLFYLLVGRGVRLAQALPAALAPDGTIDRAANAASEKIDAVGFDSSRLQHHVHHAAEELSSFAASFAGAAVSIAFGLLLTTFFTVMTVHFMLSRWARLAHWTEALSPLRPAHTRLLLRAVQKLGREIMLSTVVLGVVQGGLAGLAYTVLGVPQAAFFAAMTAVASTVPAVGTMLIWMPIGAYLIASGHPTAGAIDLLWGAFVVVTLSDGVLRPLLVGRKSHMGILPALIGLFGGVELFGFIGLLLGPMLVGLSLAILRLYAQGRARRAALERADGRARVHVLPRKTGST